MLKTRFLPCGLKILVCASWICAPAVGQPTVAPGPPPPAMAQGIEDSVASLVEATRSDDGCQAAQTLVVGASREESLSRAWQQWRRAAQLSEPPITWLLLREVEVEEFRPEHRAGGALTGAATALVRVRLDVATEVAGKPETEWPAEPWQGEFTLQKTEGDEAPWQFAAPLEDTPHAEDALIDLPERGGNRLEQAIRVVRQPEAMLVTARVLTDTRSLSLLVAAVQRYVALTGHYPPAEYSAVLLEREPPATQTALRRAFGVEATPRLWVLNPTLAGTKATGTPDQTPEGEAVSGNVPLFWDGTPQRPSFSLAGQSLIAFSDGRIELRRAPDWRRAPDLQDAPRKD